MTMNKTARGVRRVRVCLVSLMASISWRAWPARGCKHRGQEGKADRESPVPNTGSFGGNRLAMCGDSFTSQNLDANAAGPLAIGHVALFHRRIERRRLRDVQPFFGEFSRWVVPAIAS